MGSVQKFKNILTKEFFQLEYIKNKKSFHEISQEINVSYTTIWRYAHNLNILSRSVREATKFRHERFPILKENHSRFKGGKKIVCCSYCNKKLLRWLYQIQRSNLCFCSYKCRGSYFSGKNCCLYIHGNSYQLYPSKFSSKLRQFIRKRDNFTCQKCGLTNIQSLNKFNEILHVHHIDYNKENCDENNLITLCCTCNIKANFNIDYWYAYYTYIINQEEKNGRLNSSFK